MINYDDLYVWGNADYYCYKPTRIYLLIIGWYDDTAYSRRLNAVSMLRGFLGVLMRLVEE
jgi:hypothetical protein